MFGSLGLPEILLILVLALLIFGPKRLPEVGRTIGRGLSEFRRATTDLKRSVNAELSLEDDERPPTSRRPSQSIPGVGRSAAEASSAPEVPHVEPHGDAPEGTAPRSSTGSDAVGASDTNEPSAGVPSPSEPSEPSGSDRESDGGESAIADEPSKPAGNG